MTLPRPRALVTGLLMLAWGTALCFVPLLNLLAFEAAMFTTLPVTFLAGHRGARLAPTTWRATGRALLHVLLLAALPIVPLLLNMLRVRNCNVVEGLLFHALLPGVTAVVAFLTGLACRGASPRRPFLLFTGVFFGSVLVTLGQFWFQPPVDAFHPFVGYFPGSLYDEVIPLSGRLVGARAIDIAYAAAVLLLVRGGWRRRALGLALGVAGWLTADALVLHRGEARVAAELGGERETPHYRVFYPRDIDADRLDALTTELEFLHAELGTFFGRAPAERVTVWLYASTLEKKTLMGAGLVRIAKPWQRAVHLQLPAVGEGVLAHELAHAFSAEISAAPHHLSLTGWGLPNMGLIEGLATAAAWDDSPLDAHQWSAAMAHLQVGGRLEDLLRPHGFLAQSSRAAYTQCGSFVRWLRDTEGPAAVETLYRAGSLPEGDTRIDAWRTFVQGRPVDAAGLAVARLRFDRPAIFGKTCAHEVAALRVQLADLSAEDPARAAAVADEILGHLPGDADTELQKLGLLARLATPAALEEALVRADALAARDELGRVRQARAREWIADLLVRRGRPEDRARVRALYAELREAGFDRAWTRRVVVKLLALDASREPGHEAWGEKLLAVLTQPDGADPDTTDTLLREAAALRRTDPLTRYLMARLYARQTEYGIAIAESETAATLGLPHPTLTFEALRLAAACRFERRDFTGAARAFEDLARRGDLGLQAGEAAVLATWSRRARFFGATAVQR